MLLLEENTYDIKNISLLDGEYSKPVCVCMCVCVCACMCVCVCNIVETELHILDKLY